MYNVHVYTLCPLLAYPQPRSSIPTQHSVEVGQTIGYHIISGHETDKSLTGFKCR